MILFIRRAGILLLIMILIVLFLIINIRRSNTVSSNITPTVVIDAGHGSPDGGAIGIKTKVLEEIKTTYPKYTFDAILDADFSD